jgi:hypothetical protein
MNYKHDRVVLNDNRRTYVRSAASDLADTESRLCLETTSRALVVSR